MDIKLLGASLLLAGVASAWTSSAWAAQQSSGDDATSRALELVKATVPSGMDIGEVKVKQVAHVGDTLAVDLNETYADVPFTRESIKTLENDLKAAIGNGAQAVKLTIEGTGIDEYFTNYDDNFKRSHSPFVQVADKNAHYSKGLDGNIVALWQSHGWYFEPKLNRWEWQRARLLQTVEDIYTQSYVLQFLNPMLENAGAYVWDPRDRDTGSVEVIVDNDGDLAQKSYRETARGNKWEKGKEKGFAYKRQVYKDFENPFDEGTYRMARTTTDKSHVSEAHWDATMPKQGDYAIYVSYKTVPGSASDATYTINSMNGKRTYKVDQRMAGGVWVYLGTFTLAAGENKDVVTLSNLSSTADGVVTADAIKIGGGMGNIARRPAERTAANVKLAEDQNATAYLAKDGVDYKYITSGRPRYLEGARYFLQWSGFPSSVYSPTGGINDYNDDYRCRGDWVNYLAGGSQVLPNGPGLNVPVDLSFAFHTNAGDTHSDEIYGTLGIYCTKSGNSYFGRYANGTPRSISRNLTNLVVSQIVSDVRATYEPKWTRRGMWDKSYYEARVPEVPSMLLEFLSHQNFADMKYGLDPSFRFMVSRAIYKGILKFIAQRDHRDYVVQPLPVNSFAIRPAAGGTYLLTWEPTRDTLSTNADATRYVVLERKGLDGAFKEIAITPGREYLSKPEPGIVYSYKIVAMNDGGRSFPSEILSLGVPKHGGKGTVMVVNGFTRVSAPDWFESGNLAGFLDVKDHGVPYIEQINYLGSQYEFRRNLPWRDDDAGGFGASRSNFDSKKVAGNTFDYPAVHGEAIIKAGYSFVSTSLKPVEDGMLSLKDFATVDLIMGKQKEVKLGRGAMPNRYRTFSAGLMNAIKEYTAQGGNVMVTGAYIGTDTWDGVDTASVNSQANNERKAFIQNVLGYKWLTGQAAVGGNVYTVPTQWKQLGDGNSFDYASQLNDSVYAVESPDAIVASDDRGVTFARYGENNIPAGVTSARSGYRTIALGIPFEAITSKEARERLMADALNFLNAK